MAHGGHDTRPDVGDPKAVAAWLREGAARKDAETEARSVAELPTLAEKRAANSYPQPAKRAANKDRSKGKPKLGDE